MKTKESKQKNLLIGGLLAIVLIMAVGYAAFATQLNITGTASFDNTWCIGFDSRNTSAYQATAGVSGGTVPTGSISFDGNTCATNYKTDAALSANFKQPGDKIVYTLTIANKSTLTAAIKSIKVEDESVTADKTITKGNVKFTVEMPESTTLAANATTTMKVTAEFQNDTDINKYTTGETQTLDVEINAQQDDGNGGFTPTSTLVIDQTFVPDYYRYETTTVTPNSTPDISSWTTDPSTLGKDYYLGYDLDGTGKVTASYVCFILNNTQYCLQGGDNSYWPANKVLLERLRDATPPVITCSTFTNSSASCTGGSLGFMDVGEGIGAQVGTSQSMSCFVAPYFSTCQEH